MCNQNGINFFIKWVNSSQYIYLVVHVDDFTVFGSNQEMIEEFHQHMNQKYDVTTNLDGVFLGILQTRMPNGDCVFTRPYQLQSIFDRWLPNWVRWAETTRGSDDKSYVDNYEQESSPCDKKHFKSLLGSLMWMFDVQPGIVWAVSKISQRQEALHESDMEALLQVAKYLYVTRSMGTIKHRRRLCAYEGMQIAGLLHIETVDHNTLLVLTL